MAIKINLNFDETNLTGEQYGFDTYVKQIKGKYNCLQKVILFFPDNIKHISSSFIQGMFKEIEMETLENNFIMCSSSIPNIKEYVLRKIRY